MRFRRNATWPPPRASSPAVPEVEYSVCYQVCRIRSNSEIKWHGHRLFLSDALIANPLGLLAIDNDLWRIECGLVPLALYHRPQQFVKL
jgi:hypothetical protein